MTGDWYHSIQSQGNNCIAGAWDYVHYSFSLPQDIPEGFWSTLPYKQYREDWGGGMNWDLNYEGSTPENQENKAFLTTATALALTPPAFVNA